MKELRIGVVGSGYMGREVAKLLVEHGYAVLLKGRRQEDLDVFLQEAEKLLRKLRNRRKISDEEFRLRLANVAGTVTFDERFRGLHLVIESVVEDLAVKMEVLRSLEACCSDMAVLCSNTSSLSISRLAGCLRRRDRVIGLHFFHPVRFFKVVEVVRGEYSSENALQVGCSTARSLGKNPLAVRDSPAFFLSRNMLASFLEIMRALESGRYSVQDIDEIARRSDALIGPLYSADISGLDIIHHSLLPLCERIPQRYAIPPLLLTMLDRGRLGRKAGKGFYAYDGQGTRVDEEMLAILASYRTGRQEEGTDSFSFDRCLYRMLNESVHAVQEEIVSIPEVEEVIGDVPPFQKGLFRYMDAVGIDQVHHRLLEYRRTLGPAFEPAPLLAGLVEAGRHGVKTGAGFFNYR